MSHKRMILKYLMPFCTTRFFLFLAIFLTLIFSHTSVFAQIEAGKMNLQNIETVKVDDVSDDDLESFWKQAKANGVTLKQVEQTAVERKMPLAELNKLMARLQLLEQKSKSAGEEKDKTDAAKEASVEEDDLKSTQTKKKKEIKSDIYGVELFNNPNLTFEPNLRIPTPVNYQVGPDDELIIDIYGFSEATYKLKVTPEGTIRIPQVGLLHVSGLTIEQVRKKIITQLKNVYSGISKGETNVSITLGNIKSIKVMLLGEINNPGTYTLPSLATVFNALYASGGPNTNGSFRDIKVIRNGKTIATVDVYEFLLKGEAKGNIRLQDQDVIKVSPYEARVELKGEVKRGAIYEIRKSETLKDVLQYAGGFSDNAYRDKIKVVRNTNKQKTVADVNADVFDMFYPEGGDVYIVDVILDRFENRVQINGAVFRSGVYALEEGMTLSKLIKKADGLKEDAFMTRATIYRLKPDNFLEALHFSPEDVVSGKSDITLQREDVVEIASKLNLREAYNVTVYGEVMNPATFPFAENMTVEDLILAAGGLKESAETKKVEIARRIDTANRMDPNAQFVITFSTEINRDLTEIPGLKETILQPFDMVMIYPKSGFIIPRTMKVLGQVMHPGDYVISINNERVSSIIKRSGGLTVDAFPEGAILMRERPGSLNQRIIMLNKRRALSKLSKDEQKKEQIEMDEFSRGSDLVSIDLIKALKNPGGKDDIMIQENDIISIPRKQQTVLISGEVLFPVKVVYNKGLSYRNYISMSGGYTTQALKRKAYVVYANGTARSTKSFLGIKMRPKVKVGSEIIVPPKEKKEKLSTGETLAILTSTTTIVVLMITLFRQ